MRKAAFIFPGQGSQYVGMGKDLAAAFPRARVLYEEADETLGLPISRMSFEGDGETLTATKNAQPAILIHSIVMSRILREEGGIEPSIAAGHSLGEYSALVSAGALDEMDALRIVRRRGELMFEAGVREPGTMAAIIGLERPEVEAVCRDSTNGQIVVVANVNAPGQIVISGHVKAVERAMGAAQARGAKKVIPLNVSGAFHSPLVASAQRELVEYIRSFTVRDARVGIVCNADAKKITKSEEIVDALGRQLTSPVLWSDSMTALCAQWDGPILEVGPGKVLAGLLKRIDGTRSVQNVGTAEELARRLAPEAA
jgi:[acyl-carrier-protein] S-malonyltransferase